MNENTSDNASVSTPFDGFTQMADALRDAVSHFQQEQTPESFATIITALSAFGLSSAEIWKTAAGYTRRHPLQVAALAGLAFFAFKGLTSSSRRTPLLEAPDVHH